MENIFNNQLALALEKKGLKIPEPKAPFDMGNGMKVLEWRVKEPDIPYEAYTFESTIEYEGVPYHVWHVSKDMCLVYVDSSTKENLDLEGRAFYHKLSIGYNELVAALRKAKGLE